MERQCPECDGHVSTRDSCPECDGTGTVEVADTCPIDSLNRQEYRRRKNDQDNGWSRP